MAFQDLVKEFQTEIGTYCAAIYDENELTQNDAPPRFVFVPRSHKYKAEQEVASRSGLTKALWTRVQTIDLHCWGATPDDCELLEAGAITALRSITKCNVQGISAQWKTPNYAHCGRVLVLTFDWVSAIRYTDLKLLPPSQNTATIDDVQLYTTGAVAGDGIMVGGEDEIFDGD